jgi:hypothetical protein
VHWIDKGVVSNFNARKFQDNGKGSFAMDKEQISREILTKLAVPLGVAGQALGLGRHAARTAAARGDIPTLPWRGKQAPVPTWWLRRVLKLSGEDEPTSEPSPEK